MKGIDTTMSQTLLKKILELQTCLQKLSIAHQSLATETDQLKQEVHDLRIQTSLLSEDIHDTVGLVRIKTTVESYLGSKGFTGKDRQQFVRSFKEKEGLMDGNSLQYLTQKYTTETLENTTHAVTVKRGFAAIKEELKNNKMPVEDFLILLGILYTLHAKETGVDVAHCHVKVNWRKGKKDRA
jgi:hypothetical protein